MAIHFHTQAEALAHIQATETTSLNKATRILVKRICDGEITIGTPAAPAKGMTLEQIKTAVDAGQAVYHQSVAYEVRKWNDGRYMIVCTFNDHAIGLTWLDGVTMNGTPEQFYTTHGYTPPADPANTGAALNALRELVRAEQARTQALLDMQAQLAHLSPAGFEAMKGYANILACGKDWRDIGASHVADLLNVIKQA